jgi:hypothetical protein
MPLPYARLAADVGQVADSDRRIGVAWGCRSGKRIRVVSMVWSSVVTMMSVLVPVPVT